MVKTLAIKECVTATGVFLPSPLFSNEQLSGSIPSWPRFFSLNLSTGQTNRSDNHTLRPDSARPPTRGLLPLRRYKLRLARGLQLESRIRNPLMQLDVRILGHVGNHPKARKVVAESTHAAGVSIHSQMWSNVLRPFTDFGTSPKFCGIDAVQLLASQYSFTSKDLSISFPLPPKPSTKKLSIAARSLPVL